MLSVRVFVHYLTPSYRVAPTTRLDSHCTAGSSVRTGRITQQWNDTRAEWVLGPHGTRTNRITAEEMIVNVLIDLHRLPVIE